MSLGGCLAASLTTFVVGGLWYSPVLFLKPWEAARYASGDRTPILAHGTAVFLFSFLFAFGGALTHATLLAPPMAPTLAAAVQQGVLLGAGVAGTSVGIQYQFANRPWTMLLIDAAYHVVQFACYAAVLYLWPFQF